VRPPITVFTPPWKLTRDELRKREAIPKESPPPERAKREEKISPPATTAAPTYEVHEGPLPAELQQIFKTPSEAYAAATPSIVKREELKTDVASLLASKSGLREAIILREILGPPRSLRALEFIGS
jgi:hypothetical protein